MQENLPYSVAEEFMQLMPNLSIKVDVLNDGRRVIREEEMQKFYDYLEKC